MASGDSSKNSRGRKAGDINETARRKKQGEQGKAQRERDRIQREKSQLNADKARARFPQTSDIATDLAALETDLIETNRQESEVVRLLELERRQSIMNLGTTYVPDVDGIVQASYGGMDSNGNHRVNYKGKSYKALALGETSIPKGTFVQLWFSGNSYHITW